MNTIRELHDRAMELAQLAFVARHQQEPDRAAELARQAYALEEQAADLVPLDGASEPTRSILYRSAASLAYQGREFEIAQRLIAKGLLGQPPPQIKEELNNLYDQIRLEADLSEQGALLEHHDLQLTLRGVGVGFGTVPYKEFVDRIEATKALLDRTTQRLLDLKYRRGGAIPTHSRPFSHYLAAPEAGSFSIVLKLTTEIGKQLPLLISASDVINEVLSGIELLNRGEEEQLRDRIPQEAYYVNFVTLTRKMAPDGAVIANVAFTSKENSVGLTRVRQQMQLPKMEPQENDVELQQVTVDGVLDYASARKSQEMVGLTDAEGKEYTIVVQEGLDDLVRSYFGQEVTVEGLLNPTQREIRPIDIVQRSP